MLILYVLNDISVKYWENFPEPKKPIKCKQLLFHKTLHNVQNSK